MKINNISAKTSTKNIVYFSVLCIVFTAIMLTCYSLNTQTDYSISNFFSWYISTFNNIQDGISGFDDKILTWFVFIIFPFCIYGGLIYYTLERHISLKEFNSKLNLKSVEFLDGRINFNFTQPQCNIVCGYKDIEKLNMIIHTIRVQTKHSSYPAVSEIELEFSLLNNKTFSLKNTPNKIMDFIFAIIDYSRNMQNFSYCFKGYMEIEHIKEKIEDYLHKGFKQILSNSQETTYKLLSIIFFVIALVF